MECYNIPYITCHTYITGLNPEKEGIGTFSKPRNATNPIRDTRISSSKGGKDQHDKVGTMNPASKPRHRSELMQQSDEVSPKGKRECDHGCGLSILVCGKTGIGKSTLINESFGAYIHVCAVEREERQRDLFDPYTVDLY